MTDNEHHQDLKRTLREAALRTLVEGAAWGVGFSLVWLILFSFTH
jgi:hypothetical protein